MHTIHIIINLYLQHLFNAQYLASQFNNMFCKGAATAAQCFYVGFALNMAINMTISLYKSSPVLINTNTIQYEAVHLFFYKK